jgi:hypothetical protein
MTFVATVISDLSNEKSQDEKSGFCQSLIDDWSLAIFASPGREACGKSATRALIQELASLQAMKTRLSPVYRQGDALSECICTRKHHGHEAGAACPL